MRKKEKNVILFLDLQNFSSLLTLLLPSFNTKWWWLGTRHMFSLAYYQEIMACVWDTALCTCSIHLQGTNPSVIPLTCSDSQALPDLVCRSSQSPGMLPLAGPTCICWMKGQRLSLCRSHWSQSFQTSNSVVRGLAVALLSFLSMSFLSVWISSLPCLYLLALTGFPVREFGLLSLVVPLWRQLRRASYQCLVLFMRLVSKVAGGMP